MKNKKIILGSITAVLIAVSIIAGCKKKEDAPVPVPAPHALTADSPAKQSQKAGDQLNFENETNQAMDDCNSALQGVSTTRGTQTFSFCNVTIDSSQQALGKIKLTYTGNDCYNTKLRSGVIEIQLPFANGHVTTWSTAGVTSSLTFINYKVTYIASGKSLLFNGIHKVTNINGGGLVQLYFGTPIIHKIRAAMQVAFDDSTAVTWNVARKRTFTYTNSLQKVWGSEAGDTIMGGYNHVAIWGINRIGEHFTFDVPTDITYDIYYLSGSNSCIYRPLHGQLIDHGVSHEITVDYGVDSSGTAQTSGCPYGYKISWTDSNGSLHFVLPYL